MAIDIHPDDVKNGKAIPQPGDMAGGYKYMGGGLTDPSRYQPLDPTKDMEPVDLGFMTLPARSAQVAQNSAPAIPLTSSATVPGSSFSAQYLQDMNNRLQKSFMDSNLAQIRALPAPPFPRPNFGDLSTRKGRYEVPDVSSYPNTTYTNDQLQQVIDQAQTLPAKGRRWEWATTHTPAGWSDWGTMHLPDTSTINGKGDMSLHYHPATGPAVADPHFLPGPADHVPAVAFGQPTFILTPDTNTILNLGIENGKYMLRPVWQRPGTVNPQRGQYEYWHPTGKDE